MSERAGPPFGPPDSAYVSGVDESDRPSALADLVEREHEQLLGKYEQFLYATSVPPSMDRTRALDSAGDLLLELARALRDEGETHLRDAELSESAAIHGRQRFELGLDLPTLICDVSLRELRILARLVMGAATRGAEAYARERDAATERRTAQHVGFLAHELRNPLGSIALGMQIAKQAGDVRPSRTVSAIDRSVARMQRLIDESLIDLRVRGGAEAQHEPLDLRELLSELREDMLPEVESKGQQLAMELSDDLALEADPRLLRSALSNLLRNAVK